MAKGYELHAGHWENPNSGAVGIIKEVVEARKVTMRVNEILKSMGVSTEYFEDNSTNNQRDNVNYLIKQHNKDRDDIIVSIHFNASGATTDRAIGTEVLYYNQKALAQKLADAISDASGLKNRGAKERKDLGVLARTFEPAVLIEICFVNSSVDVALYRRDFEKICQAIAKVLAEHIGVDPKPVAKPEPSQKYRLLSGSYPNELAARKAGAKVAALGVASAKYMQYPNGDGKWRWQTGSYPNQRAAEAAVQKIISGKIASVVYVKEI